MASFTQTGHGDLIFMAALDRLKHVNHFLIEMR